MCPLHAKVSRTLNLLHRISHLIWMGAWATVAALVAYAVWQLATGPGVTYAWTTQVLIALLVAACGRQENRMTRRLLGGTAERVKACTECGDAPTNPAPR